MDRVHAVSHGPPERRPKSFLLWDPEGRLVGISAQARVQLAGGLRRSDLGKAAGLALQQLQRPDVAVEETLVGRPEQLRSARGLRLLVEFSWIAGSDRRPWLLAELQECDGGQPQLGEFTDAENRVLRLLVQGLANREICGLLKVSNETVKTHVKHILAKLGTSSRSKAANIARELWELQKSPTATAARR